MIHELQAKIQAMLATLSAKAQENLTGIRVVRAYGQETAEVESFDDANRQYVGQNIRMIRAWSMFFPALQLIIGFSIVFVLWEGSRMVVQNRISLGALTAFYTFVGQLVFPMVALGFVTNIFQRGAASMGRLNHILDASPAINDSAVRADARNATSNAIRGEIEFRDLTFTYPTMRSGNGAKPAGPAESSNANEPVLRNINLRIPAGSTVAIVGPTGSGKTTLAALIARLWEAPPEHCSSTVSRFASGRWPSYGAPWVLCRRMHSCSARRFARTSRSALTKFDPMPWRTQLTSPASPATFRTSLPVTKRLSESAVLRFPAAKSSAPRSRVR